MGLRVSLHEGDKVLWDLPLEEKDWEDGQKETLRRELGDLDKDLDTLCGICDFYSTRRDCRWSLTYSANVGMRPALLTYFVWLSTRNMSMTSSIKPRQTT